MEKIITITQTKNLLLDYNTITDTFSVRDTNTSDIIFKCCDLYTLTYWATYNAAYTGKELRQIVDSATAFIPEQEQRCKNLLDAVFQKNDNNTDEA